MEDPAQTPGSPSPSASVIDDSSATIASSAVQLRGKLAQLKIRTWADECLDLAVQNVMQDTHSAFRVSSSYGHYASFGQYDAGLQPLPLANQLVYLYSGSVDALPRGAIIVPTLAHSHGGQVLAERDTCSFEVDNQYYVIVRVPRNEDAPALRAAYDTALSAAHFSGRRVIVLPLLAGTAFPTDGLTPHYDDRPALNSVATTAAPVLGYTPIVPAVHILAERLRSFLETMPPGDIDALFVCVNNERALQEMRRVLPSYLPVEPERVNLELERRLAEEKARSDAQAALFRRSQPKPPRKPVRKPAKR